MIQILDASVVLKWFLEEPGTDHALLIKQQYERNEISIVAPDLLIYELANVLRYKKSFTEHGIKTAIKSLYDLRINFIAPTLSIMEEALALSVKNNLSVYDCVYVALAKKLSSIFITADKKLYLQIRAQLGQKIILL